MTSDLFLGILCTHKVALVDVLLQGFFCSDLFGILKFLSTVLRFIVTDVYQSHILFHT